jgi:arylsulfatase A-like enzyme
LAATRSTRLASWRVRCNRGASDGCSHQCCACASPVAARATEIDRMNKHLLILGASALLLPSPWSAAASDSAKSATAAGKKPNILLIVGDDLGYSDLGAFGSENKTPNLDSLANRGRILRNFYVAPTCSPTRSILLSGTDNHLAGLGSMREELAPEQEGKPGYEGVLATRVAPLPALLKDAGYRTYQSGKWHLGGDVGQGPVARGFDRSFALVQGGASHFKQPTQAIFNGTPEPTYLENDVKTELPDDFFSSKTYTDKLLSYLDADSGSDKPFFAYLTYTAPHWPIQAPDANLERVKGRYDAGYEVLAAQRLATQKRLGLAEPNATVPPLPAGARPWNDLTDAEKARSSRVYEAYAAAIESLDDNVGRVIERLKSSGELDNTFIFFLADNGSEGNDISQSTEPDGKAKFDAWRESSFDTSLENIGRPSSFEWIGEAWGQVSSLPNRLYKGTTTEGGIRAPAFVYFPRTVSAGHTTALVTARDVLPTFLELAGTKHPGVLYQGVTVLPPQGTSIVSHLEGSDTTVHNHDYVIGTELFGRSAVRKGDWKIVRLYAPVGSGAWQLFNLRSDPEELTDLASSARYTDKLTELERDWRQYVQQNNVIELGYDFGYGYGL